MPSPTDKVPSILPFQPFPAEVRHNYLSYPDRVVTSLYRKWRPGDSSRCRLCAACTARGDACLITIGVRVPEAGLALFSLAGLLGVDRQRPLGAVRDRVGAKVQDAAVLADESA